MEIKNLKFMRKFYFNIILKCSLILVFITSLNSCDVIFEKKLDEDEVVMIIPNHNDTLTTNEVHFKWEELTNADRYSMQIVSPSFSNIQNYVMDSVIFDTEIKVILPPGAYEFKLRAENSAYVADYFDPIFIYVDSVSDLSNQIVSLASPADNIYTNETNWNDFSWTNLYAADYYVFQLKNGGANFASSSVVYQEPSIYGLSYDLFLSSGTTLSEGIFFWGIQAVNSNSSSSFSSRQINVDLTEPNTPVLLSPIDNFTSTSNQVTFKWSENGPDPGEVNAPLTAVVDISSDTTFLVNNTIVLEMTAVDSVQYTFSNSGDFYWRAYLYDAANNVSFLSAETRKITIP